MDYSFSTLFLLEHTGGFMDRLDCQMVMILFTFVYLTSFVLPSDTNLNLNSSSSSSLSEIIQSISGLNLKDQQHLMNVLQKIVVTTTTSGSGSDGSSSSSEL